MMKNIYLIITVALILVVNCGIAQDITWGQKYTEQRLNSYKELIQETESHFYILKKDSYEYYFIERYRKEDLKREYSKQFQFHYQNDRLKDLQSVWIYRDTINVFYTGINDDDYGKLFLCRMETESGNTISDEVFLDMEVDRFKERCEFYVIHSSDYTKMLIMGQFGDAYFSGNTRNEFLLYDKNLGVIAKREEDFGSSGRDYGYGSHMLDNNGTFYYLQMRGGEASLTSFDGQNSLEPWSDYIDLTHLGLDLDAYYKHIRLSEIADNQIVVTGLYYLEGFRGYLYMVLNKEFKEIIDYKVEEIDEAFNKAWATESEIENDAVENINYNFNIQKILPKEDGGIVYIGERFYTEMSSMGKFWKYKDLIVFNIDAEGNMQWVKRVPKNQIFHKHTSLFLIGDGGSLGFMSDYFNYTFRYYSFLPVLSDNELHLFYYDNPNNIDAVNKKNRALPTKLLKRMALIHRTLDLNTGEMTSEVMKKEEAPDMKMQVSFSSQDIGSDKIITYSRDKKEFRFGMMEL